MPRGIQLVQLVQDVRAEIGHSQNPALGQTARAGLVRALQRVQQQLYADFEWPHLKVDRDIVLAVGQRYYGFPDDLDFDRMQSAAVKYGSNWVPLAFGIGVEQLALYDSDAGVRGAPALRWDGHEESQIEIWPIPSEVGMTLRLHGIRKLRPLVNDADTCDLDSELLIMFVAAEYLAQQKNPKADKILRAANSLYSRLRAQGSANKRGVWVMGGGTGGGSVPGKIEIPFAPRGR